MISSSTICKATGNRLATYKEIETAYNKGGDWCSYGWSEGQFALYPTQESTYQKLSGYEDQVQCGKVGINGGYFDASYKFGVNCYGYKPITKKSYTSKTKYNYGNNMDFNDYTISKTDNVSGKFLLFFWNSNKSEGLVELILLSNK